MTLTQMVDFLSANQGKLKEYSTLSSEMEKGYIEEFIALEKEVLKAQGNPKLHAQIDATK